MKPFFSRKRTGIRRPGTIAALMLGVLIIAAIATSLSLEWPRLWGLFVVLEAVIVAPLAYAFVRRPAPAHTPLAGVAHATGLVDETTRTLNRRGITSSLIEAMAQSQRYNTPLSLACLRIDDPDGLAARLGDGSERALLETASAVLGEGIRLPDRLGRYQDHEFLVVLPQTRLAQATLVAERLRGAVAQTPVTINGEAATFTVSGGVAEFGRGQDLERFLANVHEAVEHAGRQGGNAVHAFKPQRARGAS